MNSLSLHEIPPQSPDLLQQVYGVVNGVFLVCAVLVLLTGISHYKASNFKLRKSSMSASFTYFLVFLGFAAFGLYNIFYQSFTGAVTTQVLPEWLFYISRYGSPIALASITFIFLLVTKVQSYRAFRFQEKYRYIINALYIADLAVLVALGFMHNINHIAFLNGVIFVPHCIGAVLYCLIAMKDTPYCYIMAFMFGLMAVVFAEFNRLLFVGELNFSPEIIAAAHATFASTHTIFTFITLRFGYAEMMRFIRIRQMDNQHLIHGFGEALKNDEFFLVYQPQVKLSSNEISGVETLIRWQHPEHGLIPPATFIELAEVSDKINDICFWVVSRAIRDVSQLQEELKHNLSLSINFSAKNLNQGILNHLKQQFERYNFPAESLIVEITETVMIEDNSETRMFLDEIDTMGIKLSVDDYGTGFSSLSYLNKLQVSELKLDRSFVYDIAESHDHFVISHSTVTMSKRLGYKVVAEGVESAEAMSTLHTIGCDYAQGFYIGRPMPLSELRDWMQSSPYNLTI